MAHQTSQALFWSGYSGCVDYGRNLEALDGFDNPGVDKFM